MRLQRCLIVDWASIIWLHRFIGGGPRSLELRVLHQGLLHHLWLSSSNLSIWVFLQRRKTLSLPAFQPLRWLWITLEIPMPWRLFSFPRVLCRKLSLLSMVDLVFWHPWGPLGLENQDLHRAKRAFHVLWDHWSSHGCVELWFPFKLFLSRWRALEQSHYRRHLWLFTFGFGFTSSTGSEPLSV